jgi:hypothetical protein
LLADLPENREGQPDKDDGAKKVVEKYFDTFVQQLLSSKIIRSCNKHPNLF